MTVTDPDRVLLAHDRWATDQLLGACESLSEDQFHRTFEMGVGTMHATMTHVLGAMRGWTDVLTVTPDPRGRLEDEGRRTPGELRALLAPVADEFAAAALAGDPGDVLRPERGGKTYAFTRGGILVHVATHGMHHRAQCLNMLRQMGAETLPPSSVMEWMMMADPAG